MFQCQMLRWNTAIGECSNDGQLVQSIEDKLVDVPRATFGIFEGVCLLQNGSRFYINQLEIMWELIS